MITINLDKAKNIARSEERRVGKECSTRDWSSDVCSSDLYQS